MPPRLRVLHLPAIGTAWPGLPPGGIKLDVEERTAGELSLGSGTLYQAIARLEREGLIAAAPAPRGADPRRGRIYRLEPLGRSSLDQHLRRLRRALDYARARKLLPSEK